MSIEDRIRSQITQSRVVLYMKGSPDFPQCGFSNRAIQMLRGAGATFDSYDVLQDPELREGLKVFSSWPTFPQLYVDGRLVGGSDIMAELDAKGELKKMVAGEKKKSGGCGGGGCGCNCG